MSRRVHHVTLGDPESDPEVDNGYISVNSRQQHNRSSGGRQQSRGGVQTRGNTVEVTLGDVNPYETRSDSRNRNTGHRSHHNDRDQGRHHHHHSRRPPSDYDDDDQDQDDDQGHEEDGVVSLSTVNPFARGGSGNGNSNRNANANTGRNSNTGRNTSSQPASRQRPPQPPARQVVSESDSEEETDDDSEEEEALPPPPPTARTRAGAIPSNSRLLQQAPPATSSKTKPLTIGAQESKQQPKTIPGPSKAAVADSDEDSEEDSDEDSEEEPVKEKEDSESESDDDDDGLGAGPHAVPTDPKAKGKGKEGAASKGKGKEAGPSGTKKSGGNDKVNISTSDSWSGEIGRPEGFDHHHHHHHHRHRSKREYPAADYKPDPDFFETSSSSTSTTSSSSDSSSSFDCDCPRGKHLHHCRFRRDREREFDCDCPRGKHHRHCRHHHRHHSRHDRERDREHAWEREHMRGREYGFDCDCRGGFHHQHCPFWRRPPHFHGHHHQRGPKPWDQPPWWPYPFPPMITQLDHKRNPFGEPLYANIPELPSLFDQVKDAYYTLPVPPTNLLRDLQEMHRRQVPYPPQPEPQVPPSPADTMLKFATGLPAIAKEKDYLSAVPAILYQQLQGYYVDMVYNRLQSMIQVRFAERKGEKIINRVHVVQRYRTAWNAVMNYRPKLDVDLVIPGDFVLRRWCITPQTKDEDKPKTISKAMGLDPTLVMRGEIYQNNLDWVIKAVWEQLNGKADGFIFPGGNAEALQYIGSFKDDPPQAGAWRIKLQSVGDKNTVWINLFVKVAIRVNGQDLVVGVDQASAVSEDKYQMVKMYHTPNGPLGESPLGPIEQCALIMLGWWKRDTKQGNPPKDPGGMKIRASHFSLALKACRELDPTDDLYISPGTGREQFSIQRSVAVALKLAKYLKMAYTSPVLVCASNNAKTTKPDQAQKPAMQFLFPLASCGILEAVYTQMVSVAQKPDLDELVKKFDELIGILDGAKGGDEKKGEGKDTKDGDAKNNGGDATGEKPGQSSTPEAGASSSKSGAAETPGGANPPAQGDSSGGQSGGDTKAAPAPTPSTSGAPESAPKADEQGSAPILASPEDPAHKSSPELPKEPAKSGEADGAQPAGSNPASDGPAQLGAANTPTGD